MEKISKSGKFSKLGKWVLVIFKLLKFQGQDDLGVVLDMVGKQSK